MYESFGVDVFGTEKRLINHLKKNEFQYECGRFSTKESSGSSKKVTFLRITSFEKFCQNRRQLLGRKMFS